MSGHEVQGLISANSAVTFALSARSAPPNSLTRNSNSPNKFSLSGEDLRHLRRNPRDFLEALHHMFNMIRRFAAGEDDLPDAPLPAQDFAVLEELTRSTVAN